MSTKKPTTSERLDHARADLQTIEQQIRDLEMQRATALLGDNDREATALGLRLDEARQVARTITDKCTLLEIEVEKEKAEAAARQHEQRVQEFADTLEQADAAGDELQDAVEKLEAAYRRTIDLRETAFRMWPHGKSSHGDALAKAPEGAAMAAGAVATLLAHELHRVSFEAPLGGRPGEKVKLPLPAPAPSRLTPLIDQKTKRPVPLKPLGEVLRNASRFAVETLRNDLFVPVVVPQPPVPIQVFGVEQPPPPAPPPAAVATPRSPAAVGDVDPLREYVPPAYRDKLAGLLRRQMQLAASGDDAAYERCLADLTTLRREIEAERSGEAAA